MLSRPTSKKDEPAKKQKRIEDELPISDTLRVGMQRIAGIMIIFGLYIATSRAAHPGRRFPGRSHSRIGPARGVFVGQRKHVRENDFQSARQTG